MSLLRICHVSSAHPADDVRIFYKECNTLAESKEWEVHLVGNAPLEVGDTTDYAIFISNYGFDASAGLLLTNTFSPNVVPVAGTIVIDGKTPLGLNNGDAWTVVMPMTVGAT